jgi:Fe-S-cluster containining protein
MTSEKAGGSLFRCRMCGDCCRGFGGTVVEGSDVKSIAQVTGIAPEDLLRRYCVPSGSNMVLAQGENGYCVFWDQVCTIHPVKPRMCRQWPHIPAVLEDVRNWHVMASVCPGMRTDATDERILLEVRLALGLMDAESSVPYRVHRCGSDTSR